MKVIVNGIEKDYTKQEIEYLKEMYGDWEKHQNVFVFNRFDFLNVGQMAKLLKLQDKTIYQKHRRDPQRFPLEKKGTATGIDSDKFLSKWIC